jgi:hypothetical protein
MNFLKKGPELKLSEIRVPGFIQDIYFDLKERHLLPVAAILLVAIVAVPFAFGQSSGTDGAGSGAGAESATATASSGAGQAGQLVAKSAPGLRDYRRRLEHLTEKDPFKQQFAESGSTSSESTSGSASGSEGAGSTETTSPTTGSTGTETGSGTEEPATATGRLRYYSYAIDVRVSTGGSQAGESQSGPASTPKAPTTDPPRKWTNRHNLPELTMLPSRDTPAIVYMGSTKDAKKALMLVSSDVTSIFGDAKCVLGSKTCELLAMEPGVPETFVYGATGKTFKIELLKVHLVETKKLNRAPLGKPKQSGG